MQLICYWLHQRSLLIEHMNLVFLWLRWQKGFLLFVFTY